MIPNSLTDDLEDPRPSSSQQGEKRPNDSSLDSRMSQHKKHKMISGMALLLNKVRQSVKPDIKTAGSEKNTKTNENTDGKNSDASVQVQGELTPSLHNDDRCLPKRTDIIFGRSSFDGISPKIKITQCFRQHTTPEFGYSNDILENNYVRSCKWSSDGMWLAVESEDRYVRIFSFKSDDIDLVEYSKISHGSLVYEMGCHPTESLFISTSKDRPIHCFDIDGKLIASFRGINSADELSSAYSLSFSLDGRMIYAGFCNYIRIFDFDRPGKQIHEIKTFAKRSINSGQKGILSSIASCPSFNGVYAVGSFTGSVGLYSTHTNGCDCFFTTHFTGITHIKYSNDGQLLYVGYRRNSCINCYDLRMPGNLLNSFYRPSDTNQRIYFQIDPHDRYLYSGTSEGELLIHDLKGATVGSGAILPSYGIKASSSTVAGIGLHPHCHVLALTTGQRVFPQPFANDSSDTDEYVYCSEQSKLDNSLQLYSLA